jgi:RimJ/RimL family protein N-acetyltransferase
MSQNNTVVSSCSPLPFQKLSAAFQVERLDEKDIPAIYVLCAGNPLYYQHCPPPLSEEIIREDLSALPPGKTYADKYFLGFYDKNHRLCAVMDLIAGYPNESTAFIGFFMLEKAMQGKGIGTAIVEETVRALKEFGFSYIRLGYVKTNPQSKHFWIKNKFLPTGVESERENYTVVVAQRDL